MCDRALLLLIGSLLRQPALGALGHEGGVVARVGRRRAALEMQHVIHRGGEEGAIVTHEQHRPPARGEVLLQPASGFEIQMIGRLVEQQHIGGRHQLARQAEAAELAAA